MSEPAKVRLVRCPKCENLLPELTNYSVYQCGGCGAVLRGGSKNVDDDTILDKCDTERVLGISEKALDKPENLNMSKSGRVSFRDWSDNDLKTNDGSSRNREILSDTVESNKADKWVSKSNLDMFESLDAFSHEKNGKGLEDLKPQNEPVIVSRRTRPVSDRRNQRTVRYSQEGPSNHQTSYDYVEEQVNNQALYGEKDRIELLREIDELRIRVSDIKDKTQGKIPIDRRMLYEDPYDSHEAWFPDRNFARPPYNNNYLEHSSLAYQNELAMKSYYASSQGIMDPRAQMHRRPPHQQPLPHPYFHGHSINTDIDSYERYPQGVNLHPHSCSCYHCYKHRQQVPQRVPPPIFYPHEDPRDYNPRPANPPILNSQIPQPLRRPPRVVLAASALHCRPIAGGAPLLTCYNCFVLLQLPKKIVLTEKNQKKIRCGACSTVIFFSLVNKKLVVSTKMEGKVPKINGSSNVVMNGASHSRFSSDDYGDSAYDFHMMDKEPASNSKSLHSTTPGSSSDEDSFLAPGDETNSIEMPEKANLSPPIAGSPLQDHFDYSTTYRKGNQFEKGNQSGRSDQDIFTGRRVNSRQNSMKKEVLATEMDLTNEYSNNTGASHDSGDACREEDQPRAANRGGKSLVSALKDSLRDLSRSKHSGGDTSDVTVNGYPIPYRQMKKAEKLAGPISPGQYWYDFRAGFWGAMGGPCLGIIPPFIDEFSHPMPENCAGGNTGVFVNGRELHHKDLELLGGRGLPTSRDRSYIVEISGRVLDEDSGEELESLGKLAPTIERVKHGFGMKHPRAAT